METARVESPAPRSDAKTALITIVAGIISAGATMGVAYLGGLFNIENTRTASMGTINLERLKFSNELIKNALSANNPSNSLLFYADIGLLDEIVSSKVREYAKLETERLKKGNIGTSLLPSFDKSARPNLWLDREFMAAFTPHARPDFVTALVGTGNYMLLGFGINASAMRLSMFLSYIAYETGGFVEVVENANYSKAGLLQVFPQRFDEAKAEEYANKPEKVLNLVYANRLGNGPESSGDGWRYRGRGFLQFIGRDSYAQYSKETGLDLVGNPDLMGDPNVSLLVAAIFWTKTGLNELADQDRFEDIAKKVSGAAIGLEPRKRLAALALKLLQDRNKTAAQ